MPLHTVKFIYGSVSHCILLMHLCINLHNPLIFLINPTLFKEAKSQ